MLPETRVALIWTLDQSGVPCAATRPHASAATTAAIAPYLVSLCIAPPWENRRDCSICTANTGYTRGSRQAGRAALDAPRGGHTPGHGPVRSTAPYLDGYIRLRAACCGGWRREMLAVVRHWNVPSGPNRF